MKNTNLNRYNNATPLYIDITMKTPIYVYITLKNDLRRLNNEKHSIT
jgi:hypothetical protein